MTTSTMEKGSEKNLHYFSRLIIETRKSLGESGTKFGKRFGVTHAAVSEWENGKTEAGWDVLFYCLNKMKIIDEGFMTQPTANKLVVIEKLPNEIKTPEIKQICLDFLDSVDKYIVENHAEIIGEKYDQAQKPMADGVTKFIKQLNLSIANVYKKELALERDKVYQSGLTAGREEERARTIREVVKVIKSNLTTLATRNDVLFVIETFFGSQKE